MGKKVFTEGEWGYILSGRADTLPDYSERQPEEPMKPTGGKKPRMRMVVRVLASVVAVFVLIGVIVGGIAGVKMLRDKLSSDSHTEQSAQTPQSTAKNTDPRKVALDKDSKEPYSVMLAKILSELGPRDTAVTPTVGIDSKGVWTLGGGTKVTPSFEYDTFVFNGSTDGENQTLQTVDDLVSYLNSDSLKQDEAFVSGVYEKENKFVGVALYIRDIDSVKALPAFSDSSSVVSEGGGVFTISPHVKLIVDQKTHQAVVLKEA